MSLSVLYDNTGSNAGYFVRLLCLLVDEGTGRMKDYVLNNLPGKVTFQLAMADSKIQKRLQKLQTKKKFLTPKQYKALYPNNGIANIDGFDMSLWYTLVRNVAVSHRLQNGQKVDFVRLEKDPGPNATEIEPQHDIIRLRNMRNSLFHLPTPELTENEFKQKWGALESILLRLGTSAECIDGYKNKVLDPNVTLKHCFSIKEDALDDMKLLHMSEIRNKNCIVGVVIVTTILILTAGAIGCYFLYQATNELESCSKNIKFLYTSTPDVGAISYMPRYGWGAMPPKHPLDDLHHPQQYVIISHTTTTDKCATHEDCCAEARITQKESMQISNFNDIAYNFVVGNDGVIYEGRGFDKQSAIALHWDRKSIGIAFMGNYVEAIPTSSALSSTQGFLQYLVDEKVLTRNFTLYGLCQVRPIFPYAPGPHLYQILTKWKGSGGNNTWSWQPRAGSNCRNVTL